MTDNIKISIIHADDTISISGIDLTYGQDAQSVVDKIESAYAGDPIMNVKVPFKSWRVIDAADVLTDRTYRNAWRDNGVSMHHDMPHAVNIHKDKLRRERLPKLAALDVEYQRADEIGDKTLKSSIAAKKQKLRDITKDARLTNAVTTEELKTLTLDVLATDDA